MAARLEKFKQIVPVACVHGEKKRVPPGGFADTLRQRQEAGGTDFLA
jgi:hypothetical protein